MGAGSWGMRNECNIADRAPRHHVLTSPVKTCHRIEPMAGLLSQATFWERLAIILQSANTFKPLISVAPSCHPPRLCQCFLLLSPNHGTTPLITTVQRQTELPAEAGHTEPLPHCWPLPFHLVILSHVLC